MFQISELHLINKEQCLLDTFIKSCVWYKSYCYFPERVRVAPSEPVAACLALGHGKPFCGPDNIRPDLTIWALFGIHTTRGQEFMKVLLT